MDTLTSLALEAMPNFVIVDARGIITYMNTTYLEMLGLTRDQVIGHSAEEVIPGTRLLTILQTGVSEIGDTMTFFHQKEQREVHVMCNRRVIRDASGQIIGALGVTTANTDEELEMLAAAYYESINGERPPISQVDHVDDEEVTIHLYEDMGDHIATWDWYTVNRSTLKGQDNLGNEIDLSSVADR